MGFISDDQLEMLLEEQQQRPGELLGKIAEEMDMVNDEQLAQALAEQMGMQVVDLRTSTSRQDVAQDNHRVDGAALSRDPRCNSTGNTLTVATCDPQNISIQDELRTFLGYDIDVVVATEPTC